MYIRLPIGNVIYCVTYMNTKQIPIYFIMYTTATKHFITKSVGQENVFYVRYMMVYCSSTPSYIYLSILSVFTRALFFTPNKVFFFCYFKFKIGFCHFQNPKWFTNDGNFQVNYVKLCT